MKRLLVSILSFSVLAISGCSDDDEANLSCAEEAPRALSACVEDYGARLAECYSETGEPCADDDAELQSALDRVESRVSDCADGEFKSLDGAAVAGRLQNSCESEASAVAWRSYGGPQGAVYDEADADIQACLSTAHAAAMDFMDDSLEAIIDCASGECDADALQEERDGLAASAQSAIEIACEDLGLAVGVEPDTYVERAALNVDCIAAAGLADTGDVPLDCGPSNAEFDAARGEWSEVVVDGEKWGTMCGDETEYAFWIRPAPEGSDLDNVVVALQGGGVCLFEDDCTERFDSSPDLFNAQDDSPPEDGIMSTDPEESPFANYTIVYLPYCTQDVFAGGGVVEEFDEIDIPRYGAVNARAATRMVRDFIWREMDAAGGDGFRSDQVTALFGGFSAGGYGTMYNYHWFLDDLLWPRTVAFPDAGLAVDNGETLGVGNLGFVKIPAWGLRPFLPPYCFEGPCSGGEVLLNALSPRLLQVPEQQILMLSNQRDETQSGDAFFSDIGTFINALRQMYCDTRDLPGVQWYLTSVSDENVHVITIRDFLWTGEVDGVEMRDWFERAVTDPSTLEDRVEEADFTTEVEGVEEFPCDLQ